MEKKIKINDSSSLVGKNSLDIYIRDIMKRPLLTKKETVELFKKYEHGDQKAKGVLIESNLRLVVSIAKQFAKGHHELEDLISEGNLGLMRSIEKFDWKKGFALTTYATWWIRQSIMRHMTTKSRTIRLPAHVLGIKQKMSKIKQEFTEEFGYEPTNEEIYDLLGVSDKMFSAVKNGDTKTISLSLPIGNDDGSELKDHISDEGAFNPIEHISNIELINVIKNALRTLSPKEEAVIRLRFGIIDSIDDDKDWPITFGELNQVKLGMGMKNLSSSENKCA